MMHNEPSPLPSRVRRSTSKPELPGHTAPFAALVHRALPPGKDGRPQRRGQPFRDAEACIFWAIKALAAGSATPGAICAPGEFVKCLDKLYRHRRIDLHHVRILRIWGHRGRAPRRDLPMERGDWRVWREAVERLDWPLRSLGIISCTSDH